MQYCSSVSPQVVEVVAVKADIEASAYTQMRVNQKNGRRRHKHLRPMRRIHIVAAISIAIGRLQNDILHMKS